MSQIEELKSVVKELRSEHGCPWDKEQTLTSLKPGVIEEAAEVICSMNLYEETGNSESMCEELGDLLLQIVLQSEMASEEGLFDFEDVCRRVKEKMILRHPHVFGDVSVENTEEVLANWAEIKKGEKSGKEWMDKKLPEAFDEAEALIDRARIRKGFKPAED